MPRRPSLVDSFANALLDTVRAEAGGTLVEVLRAGGCTEEEVIRLFTTNDIRAEVVDIATPRAHELARTLLERVDLSPAARDVLRRITVGTAAEFAKTAGKPAPRKR